MTQIKFSNGIVHFNLGSSLVLVHLDPQVSKELSLGLTLIGLLVSFEVLQTSKSDVISSERCSKLSVNPAGVTIMASQTANIADFGLHSPESSDKHGTLLCGESSFGALGAFLDGRHLFIKAFQVDIMALHLVSLAVGMLLQDFNLLLGTDKFTSGHSMGSSFFSPQTFDGVESICGIIGVFQHGLGCRISSLVRTSRHLFMNFASKVSEKINCLIKFLGLGCPKNVDSNWILINGTLTRSKR